MANQLPPGHQQAPRQVNGPIDRVPCPHCGKRNNLRGMYEQQLLDTGHKFLCDHCDQSMEVTAVQSVTVVAVRQSTYTTGLARAGGGRPRQQQRPQQAQLPRATARERGIAGVAQRLLGKGPKR